MKLSLFLSILTISQLWATETYSQMTKLTLKLEDAKISDVLREIENQSEFFFLYSPKLIDVERNVNIDTEKESIKDILNNIFDDKVKYVVYDRQIILTPSDVTSLSAAMQQLKITGTVTGKDGTPLPGVNVVVTGTTQGTLTDIDGKYNINGPQGSKSLTFSFVGMEPQEITIGTLTQINVTMAESAIGLEEVVVIGYGTAKRSDLTGAVSSISSEKLTKIATSSPMQALQGRASGVLVIKESGSPDAATAIRIRGLGTTNDASPLYVVDGFPMKDINYLSPSDIESIEILKDASSSAIYGSRGANGVVLITTKKGQAGSLKVNLIAYYGIEKIPNMPSMLNSKEYAQLSNEAYVNAGKTPIYSDINNLPYNTDWYDAVSQLGTIENYNLSISGGGPRINSLFSGTYYKNKGIIKTTDYDKLSFMQNTSIKLTNFLDIETSLSGVFSSFQNLDATSIFLSSLMAPPDIPVINPETSYYTGITKLRLVNPAGRIARNNAQNKMTYLIGNIDANFTITPDLSFKSRLGIRREEGYKSDFQPVYFETMDNSTTINQVSRTASKSTDWTLDNILTYHKMFKGQHELTVMGAISAREFITDNFTATKQGLPIPNKEFWYFDAATQNPQTTGNGAALSQASYLGRINYSFKNRYLFTSSIREDGSSRFTKSNRWGLFPSGAFAWKVSEENFIKNLNINWLSSAKVRIGYGELGNENITSYYPYLTPISQQQYYTLGTSQARINGSAPTSLGNPDVMWETSTQSDIGIDLSVFNGKLSATADYYNRKTNDILLSQSVPEISGSGSIVRNVGGMENKGFEFSITYKEKKNLFSYDISANISTNTNEVTSLGTSGSLISSFAYDYILIDFQGALGNMIRSEVGKPYGQFYGYQTNGIFQNQAEIDQYSLNGTKIQPDAMPGDFRFKDNNGDGKIDAGDMTFIGNPNPNIVFGLSFDAYYKNFDLSLLLQGVAGNDIYNASKYYNMRFDARQNVSTDYLKGYWKGENTSNSIPAVTQDLTRNGRNYVNSDYYIEDGSYARLKTIQLGYTLSPTFSNGAKPTFRFYISVQNLLTITKYSGFEPEIGGNSLDRGTYPQARTFMLGTNINF